MKRICLLVLLGFSLIFFSNASAQTKKKDKKDKSAKAESAPANNADASGTIVPPAPGSESEKPERKVDSLFISLERTPCFGHCPSYKIEIFYKGAVLYHGYNYVDHIGDFSTHVSKEQLRQLFDNAKEIKFFNLKDTYINPSISDFPTTITTMTVRGQKKTIIDGHNETPSELIFFEKMIDDMFKDTQWKQIKSKTEDPLGQ